MEIAAAQLGRRKAIVNPVPLSQSILRFLQPASTKKNVAIDDEILPQLKRQVELVGAATPQKAAKLNLNEQRLVRQDIHVKKSEELDLLFKWAENSCSYDTVLSPLWFIYKRRASATGRLSFNSVSVLGDVFSRLVVGTINIAEAKNQLSQDLFYPGSPFMPGVYLNIEDVTAHILVHSRIEDLSSVSDDLCRIKFEHKLTCVNTTCELFDIPQVTADSNSTQHFRATYDHTISMKFLVEQLWRTLADDHGRSFGCQICGVRARWERKITDTPLLLFMSFSSPLHFDVDLHLVFGGHDYDLVVVIYFGGMHYVARMIGSDGKVLEYDGMKRYGRLAEVLSDSPFSPVIIDLSGTQRQVIGTWYKKRNGE